MPGIEINQELQNLYAYNVADEVIFIQDAPSGRRGYFCMGCRNEMQAVRPVLDRKHYFRHDAKGIKHTGKCTYSDESYRHKIAKEELQRSKRIKVPALYKYPTSGQGPAMLIKDACFIEGVTVHNEVQFYEDISGNVKWASNLSDTKYLIIRADVAFFDSNDQPILIIEMVATHKPDPEKLLKLLRLGINAVAVSIPKDSPESIAATFNTSTRTKWIYNYEQESTEYVQPADGATTGVSSFDEDQRKLFAESNKCRKAQINNLIRRITRCLESEQFRIARDYFESEISRVENNSERLRRKLEDDAERYRRRIDDSDRSAGRDFKDARVRSETEILEFERTKGDLEKRYLKKADEIDREAQIIDDGVEKVIRKNGGDGRDFEYRRTTYTRERERIEQAAGDAEERIERNIDSRTELEDKYEHLRSEFIEQFNGLTEKEKRNISGEYHSGNDIPIRYERTRKGIIERYRRLKEAEDLDLREEQDFGTTLPRRFEIEQGKLREEFEDLCRSTVNGIAQRIYNTNSRLFEGHKRVISEFGRVNTITEKQFSIKRSRAIKGFLDSREYKKWI